MRLKNIYRILTGIGPIIEGIEINISGSDYVVAKWEDILIAIEKLKSIGMFESVAKELFDISPIFSEKSKSLKITNSQHSKLNTWSKEISNRVNAIIELCESLGYGESNGSFEVKLPETKDFNEFTSYVNDFNRFIKICPFIEADDSSIELAKTDIGSTWLEFLVDSAQVAMILTALAYVVQSALKIRSMYLTCEQQKEAVRGAEIKNNLAEDITDMYKNIIKATASNEVRNIEEVLGQALDPEERTSAEKSLELLGELMYKGLEVYATLDAPQEARDIFPTMDQQKLLSLSTQLLTGTNKSETDKLK